MNKRIKKKHQSMTRGNKKDIALVITKPNLPIIGASFAVTAMAYDKNQTTRNEVLLNSLLTLKR